MNHDKAPFYLAVNTCKNQDSSKPWFKKSAVGVNKFSSLMKTMAVKAGLEPDVKNGTADAKQWFKLFMRNNEIDLVRVFDAILTSR